MSATQIRKFLLRQPRPHSLRIKVADETTIMEIPASPHWAEIAESVDALGPDAIEMLDKSGKFLRAVKSEQFDDDLVEDARSNSKQAATKVAFDAETERFKIYSTHLADAHKFSTETLRFVETAFGQLAKIVEAATTANVKKDQFIDSMQRAYNKVLVENAELAASGGEDGDPMELMFKMMMAGAMQGNQERHAVGNAVASAAAHAAQQQQQKPTNGKAVPPNGKARH